MYQQDSFFDLSIWGQMGLVCISAGLFVFMILLARCMLCDRAVWIKIPGSLILFWLFVWLSPQVYYQYYWMIFESLPLQWVAWPPPGLMTVLQLLAFQGPYSLSAHGQGLLGWCLIAAPYLRLKWPSS